MLRLRVRRLGVERRDRCTDDAFDMRRLPGVVDGGRFLGDFLNIFKFNVGNFIFFFRFYLVTERFCKSTVSCQLVICVCVINGNTPLNFTVLKMYIFRLLTGRHFLIEHLELNDIELWLRNTQMVTNHSPCFRHHL